MSIKEKFGLKRVFLTAFLVAVILMPLSAVADKLDPPGAPAPTMHTMDEIFNQMSKSTTFVSTEPPSETDVTGATPIHMVILAAGSQGDILGDSDIVGRENTIPVIGFSHGLTIPIDTQSGQATGSRVHSPLMITKRMDSATPKLYQACVSGESLGSVELKFYRIDPTGKDDHYFSITLTNARVVDMRNSYPNIEQVSMVYEEIEWSWTKDGTMTQDSWTSAVPTGK